MSTIQDETKSITNINHIQKTHLLTGEREEQVALLLKNNAKALHTLNEINEISQSVEDLNQKLKYDKNLKVISNKGEIETTLEELKLIQQQVEQINKDLDKKLDHNPHISCNAPTQLVHLFKDLTENPAVRHDVLVETDINEQMAVTKASHFDNKKISEYIGILSSLAKGVTESLKDSEYAKYGIAIELACNFGRVSYSSQADKGLDDTTSLMQRSADLRQNRSKYDDEAHAVYNEMIRTFTKLVESMFQVLHTLANNR